MASATALSCSPRGDGVFREGDRSLGSGERGHVLGGHVQVAVLVSTGLEDPGDRQGDGARFQGQGGGLGRVGARLLAGCLGGLGGRVAIELADRDGVSGLDVDRGGDLLADERLPGRIRPRAVDEPEGVHGAHSIQVGSSRDVGLVVDGDRLVVEGCGADEGVGRHVFGGGGHRLVRDASFPAGGEYEVGAVGADLAGHLRGHVDGDRDEAGQGGRTDGDGEDRDEDAGAPAQDGGGDHPPEHCSSGHVAHLPWRTSAALRRSR